MKCQVKVCTKQATKGMKTCEDCRLERKLYQRRWRRKCNEHMIYKHWTDITAGATG